MRLSVMLDVPDLDRGLAFYGDAFGFGEVARPHPAYAVLEVGGATLALMAKPEGSLATPAPGTARTYARHWTPVHLDLHVDDFEPTLEAIRRLGGTVEQVHRVPGRSVIAFCADPFGHGFCLVGPREPA